MINKSWFKWAEIGISMFVAIIVGFISNKIGNKNFLYDALIGFLIPYIILLPFQIQGKSVEKTHKLDDALQKLETINKDTYDLYFTEVNELSKSINDSCESLLYKCSYTPNMELYKSVCSHLMSYFSGVTSQDYFYATAECSRNSINWFFDKYNLAGEFLPLLNEKCQAGRITDFRRLFIFNEEDLKNPVLYFLVGLHNNIKNNHNIPYCDFDFKFISVSAFKNITRDIQISDEMGVWGSHCVFIQKNDMTPTGYCFNTDQITKHKNVFDDIWGNSHCKHFENICDIYNLDIDQLAPYDDFESKVLEILKNSKSKANNNTILDDVKDSDLSLLNIKDIQNWVQATYPRSTT